ncbi:T9SS type A sorting domain-containing protein [Polaribacter sp. HaHaR_3_91]|uniref:T9SS type A sorting domain-containing protein n=1 Tax=Polaribacter sp. HaHaR_3_91 TaxID=2745561 RepID=UPI001C4F2003|nr:T9SS type A sorting domain-containing protein [Polaribacter sp. HaHaR_3_91]QXP62095.1 T9SS type A sorting domain-containing protein [Polaribacter sp. HaHaR_3_91]
MYKKITILTAALFSYFVGYSQTTLKITEIWSGNSKGNNLTGDWFEITNTGSEAWTPAMGDLYFIDDRDEIDYIDDAVLINGIAVIKPGESIIAIKDEDITEFTSVWDDVYDLTDVQIGTHDGKGLGKGGDVVNLFISATVPTDNSTRVDSAAYPDTEANPGQSYDVTKGAFSVIGEAPYVPVATAVNDEGESAIASPGNTGSTAPNLQITEIWPGNGKGDNLTGDWFEITNTGSGAWTSAEGNLYYVDDRDEIDYVDDAVLLNGVTIIQPGESIIAIKDENSTQFIAVWESVYNLTNVQIATHDGKGLGGGGDTVNLFVSTTTPTDNSTRVDSEAYPDTATNPGQSYDVTKGSFSVLGEGPFVPAATAVNNEGESAIGSPGNLEKVAASTINIVVDTANLTSFLDVSETNAGFVSGVVNDATDPASTIGIPFLISDSNTALSDLTVSINSSNEAVVSNANLVLTGTSGERLLKIIPSTFGFSKITITVKDTEENAATYTINYAASAASITPSTSRFHTGSADGSTGIAIDDDYIWIGDDEDQTIRLYNANQSGLPVKEIDFNSFLGSTKEADLEGSFRLDDTIYWIGSTAEADRSVIFTTTLSGTGTASNLTYNDKYNNLQEDLLNWDENNLHGLGANYFQLSTVLEVEALALAPNSTTTAYLGLRSSTVENKAIVIPVTNFTSLPGMPSGSATFGTPILLDLAGRSLRSMECNENGCILIGGPFGTKTDFKLYTWTGNESDQPELRNADLTALNANGSFEGLVSLPNSTFLGADGDTDTVKLLVDLGATVIYNDGEENKGLRDQWKKFRSDVVTLGTVGTPFIKTPVINEFVIDHSGTDTREFIEIYGDPFTDYSNYTIVEIEGDSGNTGLIDDATFTAGTTDENGYWTSPFQENTLENGATTFLLVKDYTGTLGDDIDTNDDGTIDTTYWSAVVDGIASSEGQTGDLVYALDLAPGFDGNENQVGGASRILNGVDTDSTSDWVRNDYNGEGFDGFTGTPVEGEAINTPNSYNKLVGPVLNITEIWPGNGEGDNLTADWFEITNNGPLPWTPELGGLYFDDDSQDPASAVLISGITSIQPGESVIAVDASDTDNYISVWGGVYAISDVQIGTYAGAGLSGGGDAVTLWIGEPTTVGTIVDFETYPDTASNPGQSYDVEKAGFSEINIAPYFANATVVNDANEAAIGSPGNKGTVLSVYDNAVNTVKTFPIPFDDTLHLQLNTSTNITMATVKIIDMLGAVVFSKKMDLSTGKVTLDNMVRLHSGVYVLHIAELNTTMKIVKK